MQVPSFALIENGLFQRFLFGTKEGNNIAVAGMTLGCPPETLTVRRSN